MSPDKIAIERGSDACRLTYHNHASAKLANPRWLDAKLIAEKRAVSSEISVAIFVRRCFSCVMTYSRTSWSKIIVSSSKLDSKFFDIYLGLNSPARNSIGSGRIT